MIDVRLIRTDPDAVRRAMSRRGLDFEELDRAIELDAKYRELSVQRDELRAQVKSLSKEVGAARKAGNIEEAEKLSAESRRLGESERELDDAVNAIADELRAVMLVFPNIPAEDVPDGQSEADNPVRDFVGFAGEDSFAEHQQVPHWEIGAELGILDLERGAKISGSGFPMFRGAGAALLRALCQFALDQNVDAYEEIRPPSLVRTETMIATGHLPKFSDDAYAIERDELWTIPTAEVPLTSLARDEILSAADLPLRMMAYTPCYRREAGAAGKDTRGLLRVHEFDKVELLAITTAEQGSREQDEISTRAGAMLAALGLGYRVLDICTGDLGQAHHRSHDFEVYAPGVGRWLEVSSVSWYADYQARRANLRYRPVDGGPPQICHTVNGSALATPRVWAALVETNRQPDGSVLVPEVLHPYMRGQTVIGRP